MEWVSGNVFIRPIALAKAGEKMDGHTHNFDHTTIVFTGAVRVVKRRPTNQMDASGRPIMVVVSEKNLKAPASILIEANAHHEITAIENNSVLWCVYSHRDPQGDVVQEYNGWQAAYV